MIALYTVMQPPSDKGHQLKVLPGAVYRFSKDLRRGYLGKASCWAAGLS